MWNFIKSLFKKKEYRYKPKSHNLYDFLMHYRNAEREMCNLHYYVYENWREMHLCEKQKYPSGKLMRRYNLNPNENQMFTWYLLEQYFKGNLTIKEDVQPVK